MNISVTPKLEHFVQAKVESGLYNNASEVIREGLRLLKEHDDSPAHMAGADRAGLASGPGWPGRGCPESDGRHQSSVEGADEETGVSRGYRLTPEARPNVDDICAIRATVTFGTSGTRGWCSSCLWMGVSAR